MSGDSERGDLAHTCKLAAISADLFRSDGFSVGDLLYECGEKNACNMVRLLADGFIALLKDRPDLKPRFRVPDHIQEGE